MPWTRLKSVSNTQAANQGGLIMENKGIWRLEEELNETEFLNTLPEEADDFQEELFQDDDVIPISTKKKKSGKNAQKRLCRKCRKPIDNANYFFCSVCHHALDDVETHYVYHFNG